MTLEQIEEKLRGTHRWLAFKFIADRLLGLDRPVRIIETGSVRDETNWSGDGCSTFLWECLCEMTGGYGVSIDSGLTAHQIVGRHCRRMSSRLEDSIEGLMNVVTESADLLYLDSWDYAGDGMSELHHVGELAVAYPRLPKGCLIAVDDCHGEYVGKHALVKRFFELIQIRPLFESYITIWEKP